MRKDDIFDSVAAGAVLPLPRRVAVAAWALILGAMVVADRQAALAGAHTAHPGLVDSAAGLDLTVGASLVTWWILGREFGWRWGALIPLFFLSMLLTASTLPAGHEGGLRAAHLAAAPLELLSLAFLAGKVIAGRKAFRRTASASQAPDVQASLRDAATEAFGPGRFADAIAYELSVLYYGLFARKREPTPACAFTYHRESAYGAIVLVLLMATAAEVASVHFLVRLWSHRLAWILTGLGLYGALWLWADWRACGLLPACVEGSMLRIRFGLRWRLDVPLGSIVGIRAPTAEERATRRGVDLRLALPGAAWKVLELDRPVEARGVYGLRRTVRSLGLGFDDLDALSTALPPEGRVRPRRSAGTSER